VLYFLEAWYKPAWVDELLELYTDSQPSLRAVWHGQLAHPFSLEPPTFHLLVHALQKVFGQTLLAERLPSFLSILVAQYCLFCLVRAIADERAGLFAMLFPALTNTFYYAAEGRTYAFVFGLTAVSMVCWALAATSASRRRFALVVLPIALALVVTSHFYGFMVLAPLWLGEVARTVRRRSVDAGVVASLLLGSLALAIDLPFFQTAATFRHSYFPQALSWRVVPQAYWTLFMAARLSAAVLAALAGIGLFFLWNRSRFAARFEFAVLVLSFCALPFFCYLISRFSHAYEPRYSLSALLGGAILIGCGLSVCSRKRWVFHLLLGVWIALILLRDGAGIFAQRRANRRVMASLVLSEAGGTQLGSSEIYEKDVEMFLKAHYYLPGAYAERFSLLYSQEVELDRLGFDAPYRFSIGIAQSHPEFHTMPYEEFRRIPGTHLVDPIRHTDDWLRPVLLDDGFTLKRVGKLLGGTVYEATAPASLSSTPAPKNASSALPMAPGE
jgi:hypothetical protein